MLKVINNGTQPTRGSKYSACVDLYSNVDITVNAGETSIIPLGVCIDKEQAIATYLSYKLDTKTVNIPEIVEMYTEEFMSSHYIQLEPRSSIRAKGLVSGTGIIDMDFLPSCNVGLTVNTKTCEGFKQK